MKCKPYRRKRLLKAASIMEAARAPPGRPSATDHSIFLLALNYGLIKHSYTLLRRCLAPLRRFRSACVWALIPYNFHLFYCETTLYTRLIQFWNALVKLQSNTKGRIDICTSMRVRRIASLSVSCYYRLQALSYKLRFVFASRIAQVFFCWSWHWLRLFWREELAASIFFTKKNSASASRTLAENN